MELFSVGKETAKPLCRYGRSYTDGIARLRGVIPTVLADEVIGVIDGNRPIIPLRLDEIPFHLGKGWKVPFSTGRMQIRLHPTLKRSFIVSFADCYILGIDSQSLVNLVGVYVGVYLGDQANRTLYRRQSLCVLCAWVCVMCAFCCLCHFVFLVFYVVY